MGSRCFRFCNNLDNFGYSGWHLVCTRENQLVYTRGFSYSSLHANILMFAVTVGLLSIVFCLYFLVLCKGNFRARAELFLSFCTGSWHLRPLRYFLLTFELPLMHIYIHIYIYMYIRFSICPSSCSWYLYGALFCSFCFTHGFSLPYYISLLYIRLSDFWFLSFFSTSA